MMAKEQMKTMLKGMSPDLADNIILLCSGMVYDCYRMLRDDAGISRQRAESSDMLAFLNVDSEYEQEDTRLKKVKKIRNANEILNVLSAI